MRKRWLEFYEHRRMNPKRLAAKIEKWKTNLWGLRIGQRYKKNECQRGRGRGKIIFNKRIGELRMHAKNKLIHRETSRQKREKEGSKTCGSFEGTQKKKAYPRNRKSAG